MNTSSTSLIAAVGLILASTSGHAVLTISSANADINTSTMVVSGATSDSDAGPASGIQNWSATSSDSFGGVTATASVSSTTTIEPLLFSLSGSSSYSKNAGQTGNINKQAYFTMNFTVDVSTEASFFLVGSIVSSGGDVGTSLEVLLNENGNQVVGLFNSSVNGSFNLSDSHTLLPGNAYQLTFNDFSSLSHLGALSGTVTGMSLSMTVVPEPSTYALLALGGAALVLITKRKNRTSGSRMF